MDPFTVAAILATMVVGYVAPPVAAALLSGLWNKRGKKAFAESVARLGLVPDGFTARGVVRGLDVELGILTRGLAGKRAQAFTEARVHLQPPLDLGLRGTIGPRGIGAIAEEPLRAEVLRSVYARAWGPPGATLYLEDESIRAEHYGLVVEPRFLGAMIESALSLAAMIDAARAAIPPLDGASVEEFRRAAYSQGLEPTAVPAGMKGEMHGLPISVWRTRRGEDVVRVRVPPDLVRALRLFPRADVSRPFELGARETRLGDSRLDRRLYVFTDDAKHARASLAGPLRDRMAAALDRGGLQLDALGLELRAPASSTAAALEHLQIAIALARDLVDAFGLLEERRGPYR